MAICRIEGCDKKARGQGCCPMHYAKIRRYGDPLGGKFYGEPKEFFKQLLNRRGEEECIIWPFSKNSNGYGTIGLKGQAKEVHRLVCIEINGKPNGNLVSRHLCGMGKFGCVNPDHLQWGTYKQNAADCRDHGTHLQGTQKPTCVLEEEQVLEIYNRAVNGESMVSLAKEFKVAETTISGIKHGYTWSWLTGHKKKGRG